MLYSEFVEQVFYPMLCSKLHFKWKTLSPGNLHHGQNQNYRCNGCAWIKKGLWQLEENFFCRAFLFLSVWNLAVHDS